MMETPPNSNDVDNAISQCPVMRKKVGNQDATVGGGWFSSIKSLVGRNGQQQISTSISSNESNDAPSSTSSSKCPVINSNNSDDKNNNNNKASLPASVEESLRHGQSPMSDQRIPLSNVRVVSSIPRSSNGGDDSNNNNNNTDKKENILKPPAHQPLPESGLGVKTIIKEKKENDNNVKKENYWVYPSEQQFYNAMRRKGWKNVREEDMNHVIQIHNAVNERTWNEVRKWEFGLNDDVTNPKLLKFLGRPNDTSPKAWLNSNVLMYNKPFDRHDWYVDRYGDGKVITRYVIDFYNGKPSSTATSSDGTTVATLPSMYLDVRPALDHPVNFIDRVRMSVKEMLPGIFPPSNN